jgi:hypothetical protein
LASSDLHDPRFHADQFHRQPIGHIYKAIEWLNEHDQKRANTLSHTTARLASMVLAIGSQGTAKNDFTEFLPFMPPPAGGKPRLRPAVAATIEDLIQTRRLPMAVIALLVEDIRSTMNASE